MRAANFGFELVSVTRRVNTDNNESAIVTYHRGDPEFDTFEQEEIELRRQFRLMTRQENGLPKSIYSSYNTFINEYLRTDCRIGSLIDETIVPPQGLRFFYCGNGSGSNSLVSQLPAPLDEPEAFFDATLSVWYGDWSFVGRVPVQQNPYRFPISVNAFDVVVKGSTSGIPNEVKDFLHNLDCFTKTQSQNYIDSHPRKF